MRKLLLSALLLISVGLHAQNRGSNTPIGKPLDTSTFKGSVVIDSFFKFRNATFIRNSSTPVNITLPNVSGSIEVGGGFIEVPVTTRTNVIANSALIDKEVLYVMCSGLVYNSDWFIKNLSDNNITMKNGIYFANSLITIKIK